jgi:rubredoxin-NAD+ reductase
VNPIVIVGTGLAGYTTAREFRKLDKDAPLVIVSGDDGWFYSKPALSNALAAKKTPAAIPVSSAAQMAAQLDATVRPRARVTGIEADRRLVRIGGEGLAYSKLVLALGAEQVRLPLQGDASGRVLTVNDLDDYATFRAAIEGSRSVAIIGAGLIGCEFANDLAGAGHAVDVIDIAPHPLGRLLPPQAGDFIKRRLETAGVAWHLGTSVAAINAKEGRLRLALADGATIVSDVVLSAVGLTPRIEMARAAGLAVNRGIVVDRHLRTSSPDIYALGDCAEVAGQVLPFVMPIMHASRALASTLAGKPLAVAYPAMPVVVKTPACPTVVCPPPTGSTGAWQVTADEQGTKALYVSAANQLLGFALSGSATVERAALAQQLAFS